MPNGLLKALREIAVGRPMLLLGLIRVRLLFDLLHVTYGVLGSGLNFDIYRSISLH